MTLQKTIHAVMVPPSPLVFHCKLCQCVAIIPAVFRVGGKCQGSMRSWEGETQTIPGYSVLPCVSDTWPTLVPGDAPHLLGRKEAGTSVIV